MRSFRRIPLIAMFAAMTAVVPRAVAAPVPISGELPLADTDVALLRNWLDIGEFFDTLDFIGSLRVFEDDASTPQHPIYYLAPVFSADTSKEIIGGQEIATDMLDYLDKLDELLATIAADPREIDRLLAVRDDYLTVDDRLLNNPLLAADARQRLVDYATKTNPLVNRIALLPQSIDQALRQLPSVLRNRVILAFLAALDYLNTPLTPAERAKAQTDPVGFVVAGLAKLRAQLALLELGVRHATFVSGMTANQMHWLGNYRAIRRDVDIRPLPIQLLRVAPQASGIDLGGSLVGQVSAPEMIRGVNASTHGACGVRTSCTVLLEYTEMGARSALFSTRGAMVMPAQFLGDVGLSPDPLITCDLAALLRHLVLPFGLGQIGNREILRALSAPDVCRTASGQATRLASAALLNPAFRDLLFASPHLAVATSQQLAADLAPLIDGNVRAGLSFGVVNTLSKKLSPRSFLDELERMLESGLMPRFPDELLAALVLSSTPTQGTTTFDFDGVPIACWKTGAEGDPYLSACPDAAPAAVF